MRATWVVWVLFVGGLAGFAGLAWQVQVPDSVVKQIDLEVAKKDKQHADEHPQVLYIAKEATHVGAVQAMAVLAVVGALLLWMCGQTKLAVVWVLAAGIGAVLNVGSKDVVDRARPEKLVLRDKSVGEDNASFPSGHAMGSMIGFGSLAYVGVVLLRRRFTQVALLVMLLGVILVIGWTRVYLRAHWLSDVVAGWALGLSWLSLCIAVAESKRK